MAKLDLDIKNLNSEERLELIEMLWESLASDAQQVPVTAAQREELDRRLDEMEAEGVAGIPWDQVLARIQANR